MLSSLKVSSLVRHKSNRKLQVTRKQVCLSSTKNSREDAHTKVGDVVERHLSRSLFAAKCFTRPQRTSVNLLGEAQQSLSELLVLNRNSGIVINNRGAVTTGYLSNIMKELWILQRCKHCFLSWLQLTHAIPSPTSTISLVLTHPPPTFLKYFHVLKGQESDKISWRGWLNMKKHTNGCQMTWVPSMDSLQT